MSIVFFKIFSRVDLLSGTKINSEKEVPKCLLFKTYGSKMIVFIKYFYVSIQQKCIEIPLHVRH